MKFRHRIMALIMLTWSRCTAPFCSGHYQQWLREKHEDWEDLRSIKNQIPHTYTCPQAIRTRIPEDSYPTAYIRDRAIKYIQDNSGSDSPQFTFVSFPDPHHPFSPPGKYWDMYAPEDFDIPVRFEDHRNPPSPLIQARRDFLDGVLPEKSTTGIMVGDDQVRQAMALTAGMISMVDDAVGDIILALKDSGKFENTVIIFNADHGDYLGDFNLLLKGPWMSEAITRVPMIWSDPSGPQNAVSNALASTIDVSASILDRAGLAPYFGIQGKCLLDSMNGKDTPRNVMLMEYNDGFARMGFEEPARVRSVVTKEWRLTLYRGRQWGELYDRINDPHQTHNLWEDPNHSVIRSKMTELLARELLAQMDESPRGQRAA